MRLTAHTVHATFTAHGSISPPQGASLGERVAHAGDSEGLFTGQATRIQLPPHVPLLVTCLGRKGRPHREGWRRRRTFSGAVPNQPIYVSRCRPHASHMPSRSRARRAVLSMRSALREFHPLCRLLSSSVAPQMSAMRARRLALLRRAASKRRRRRSSPTGLSCCRPDGIRMQTAPCPGDKYAAPLQMAKAARTDLMRAVIVTRRRDSMAPAVQHGVDAYLEEGQKRIFACAPDWPGGAALARPRTRLWMPWPPRRHGTRPWPGRQRSPSRNPAPCHPRCRARRRRGQLYRLWGARSHPGARPGAVA